MKVHTIAFLVSGNIADKKLWSGTINSLYETIKQHYNVEPIEFNGTEYTLFKKRYTKAVKLLTAGKIKRPKLPLYMNGWILSRKIVRIKADILFVPAYSDYIAYAKSNVPIIYLSDATYHALLDYYIFDATPHDIAVGNQIEDISIKKAAKIIYSSEWAEQDALQYYDADRRHVNVLPFGANIVAQKDTRIKRTVGKNVKLLFVGSDWKRKGADIAIGCVKWLIENDKGHEYELTLVGMDTLLGLENDNHFHFMGYMDKNVPEEMEKMITLYATSTLYIIPTRAECAGITYAEAARFGLPILTHQTGGSPTYVKEGVNGYLLPIGSTSKDFGEKVLSMISDNEYEKLSNGSYQMYDDKLNWNVWLNKFDKIVEDILCNE